MIKAFPYHTVSERLQSSLKILFGHWTKIMLFPIILYFFVFLLSKLSAFLETSFPKLFDNLWFASFFSLFLLAIVLIAFFIPNISVIVSTNEIMKNTKMTAQNLIINTFSNFFRYVKISGWIVAYLGAIPLMVLGVTMLAYIVSPVIGDFFFELTKIFTVVFFFVRLPRIVMSFSLGITEIKLTAKEIVELAKMLSKGHWWKIFWNLVVISLISFIFGGLLYFIHFGLKASLIFSPQILSILLALIDILVQADVLAFTLIFLFLLTKQYSELKIKKSEKI